MEIIHLDTLSPMFRDHPVIRRLAEHLRGTPYEGRVWLVGGAVRDRLLKRPESPDLDLVIEGNGPELATFLWKSGASPIEPVTYPQFGTALIRVEHSDVEIVTARRESYRSKSRKPEVAPATLEEDASRRDFTINTLLVNVTTDELRDPLGLGLRDLEAKILRTPMPAEDIFYDDPLRMLRAVRFKTQLGFELDPSVETGLAKQVDRLSIISQERIRDEWSKMLVGPAPEIAMADLLKYGLIAQFAPEFLAMVGVEQGRYHHLDVWDHTLLVLHHTPRGDLVAALAALLHDVGKPQTRTIDAEGNTRFLTHELVGAEIATAMLDRLRFPGDIVRRVALLVRNHMRLGSAPVFTTSAARRVWRAMGDDTPRLVELVRADTKSLAPGVLAMDVDTIAQTLDAAYQEKPAEGYVSPIDGAEIMALLNLEPGKAVGEAKAYLIEQILDGKLAPGDCEAARTMLQQWKREERTVAADPSV